MITAEVHTSKSLWGISYRDDASIEEIAQDILLTMGGKEWEYANVDSDDDEDGGYTVYPDGSFCYVECF